MNEVKRRSSFKQSDHQEIKKLRSESNTDRETISISSIESVSNEIFYEIFDYLDGRDIYQAFSNLNSRFQQILNSSSLLLKTSISSHPDDISMKNAEQMLRLHRKQIFSIDLYEPDRSKMISSWAPDSTFSRLESLILYLHKPAMLHSFLPHLTTLPRLFSLTIDTQYVLNDFADVYRIVFTLPTLVYFKLSIDDSSFKISLPMAGKEQLSSIKYLDADHPCTFNELTAILSYTPQLRRLHFKQIHRETNMNIRMISLTPLSNLTRLSMYFNHVVFDELEILISGMHSRLKVFSFTSHSQDLSYLDACRWERIIVQYLPQLDTFHLKYASYNDIDDENFEELSGPNQFASPFWIARKWLLEVESDHEDITYSIRPYRKPWHQCSLENIVHSSLDLSKSAQLTFKYLPSEEWHEIVSADLERILHIGQIYHLEISEEKILLDNLVQITSFIPELDTLKIHSLSIDESSISVEVLNTLLSTGNISRITKVYLEVMMDIEDVYSLMTFYPLMTLMRINCLHTTDVEAFFRDTLKKMLRIGNRYLHLLCVRLPTADDQMIKKLDDLIRSEQLLVDYTIQYRLDHIYLQWK